MKFAIVIPTYNHCDDLLKPCIESIIKNTKQTDEVDVDLIIVANGCTDNTAEYLNELLRRSYSGNPAEWLPFTLHVICDEKPLGYTKAVNLGISKSIELESNYTILMNNDVTLLEFSRNNRWLEILSKPFNYPNTGMVGTSKIIDHTTQATFIIFYMAMIKTEIFNQIGLLDEIFNPGFGEDIDFAIKLQRAGYNIVRVPVEGTGYDYTETFPLYHGAEKTMHDDKSNLKGVFGMSWDEIVERNRGILKERYCQPEPIAEPVKEPGTDTYSIVIPTIGDYVNKLDVCLDTLFDVTDMNDNIEIIIIANGTTPATNEYLKTLSYQKNLRIVYFDEPLGFPVAVNEGIKIATGKYVVILNDDVVFIPQPKNEWLDILTSPFNHTENVGITGIKKIGSAFAKQSYLMFFCTMISHELIDKISILDEHFSPAWVEDEEYCLRATQAGFKVIEIPKETMEFEQRTLQMYHRSSATLNDFDEKRKVVKRNRYYLLNKYFPNDLVNIVVATYNRHEELRRALNSIEAQTYPKIKVWVCADGHDEEVKKIVEEFDEYSETKKYIYLHLAQHEGLIGSKPRMMGIGAIADTGVVCFLDDDNVLYPAYVEKLFNLMQTDEANVISYCTIIHSHAPNPIPIPGHVPGLFEISNIDTLNVMIKSSVAKKCKLKWQHIKGQKITHDFDFISECAKHGKSVYLNEVLAEHCMSLNKVDGNNPEEMAITAPRITIGIIRHNEENFKKYLQPSLAALTNKNYDIIDANDTKMPAENYNYIINQSTNDYILFVHEDVEFSPNFLDRIWMTISQNPNFGALGIEGGRHSDDLKKSIKYEWAEIGTSKKLTTLDSSCFLINKKHNLLFDSQTFNNLHCYTEDYCMQAQRKLGLGCYTILTNAYPSNWMGRCDSKNYVRHQATTCNTAGYNWGDFTAYFNKLTKKWNPQEPRKQKIYDCFQFYNELDILDIRFNTLYDYVDKFVLVEARFTHQGNPKPLYFEENKERYAKFMDKIEHIVLDEMIPWDDPYILKQQNKQYFEHGDKDLIRERYQRDMMVRGWNDLQDDDIIIISDVDEIINPTALKEYNISMGYAAFIQRLFYYKLNCEIFVPWDKARIMPYSFIKNNYPSDVRFDLDTMVQTRIPNGGWHFSYLYNDPKLIADKIKSFCHALYNTPEITNVARIKEIVERGEDLYGRGHKMNYVPIDDNYPQYVLDNIDYFTQKGLIKPMRNPLRNKYRALNTDLYIEIFETNLYGTTKEDVEGKKVVDLGANVGFFSLLCAEYGAKEIHSFEPESHNYEHLVEFSKDYETIKPYKLAVLDGSKPYVKISNEGYMSHIYGDEGEEVPAFALSALMGALGLSDDDLVLKLDAEGSEYEIILNTAPELIKRFETIFIEIHDKINPNYIGGLHILKDYIISLGYEEIPNPIITGTWYDNGTFIPTEKNVFKFKRRNDKVITKLDKEAIRALDVPTYDEIYTVDVYRMREDEIKDAAIIDIGANYGFFSLRAVEMGAKVCYAFEPERNNYNQMLKLIDGIPKISPYKLAVSDGAVSMVHMVSDKTTSTIWGDDKGEEVKCISFVEAVSYMLPEDKKRLLKMDCEGSEYEMLLHTPPDVIQQFDYIYLEIHDLMNPNFQGKTSVLVDYLKFLGYDVVDRGPQAGFWQDQTTFIPSPVVVYKFKRVRVPMPTRQEKPRVYDCFMFNDELDVLDIRLAELNDVVDYFVIVESNFTHSGKPKPLHFKENEQRYAKYLPKIRHYVYDYTLPTDNAWHRESHQRDACIQGLYDARDYDIIISGDADEIPKKEIIANYNPRKGVVGVETKYYFYFLNCQRQDKGTTHMRLIPYHILKPYTFCFFRYKDYPMIEDGGWHFSFIGDVKQIQKKFDSYAHQEYNTEHFTNTERLTRMINAGEDILEKGMQFNFVDIDDTFPEYLVANKAQYTKYIKPMLDKVALHELEPLTYDEMFGMNIYGVQEDEIKGATVVDVGANYGFFALRAVELGAKNVYCYEPEINNFNKLKELTSGFPQIKSRRLAVFDESKSEAKIYNAGISSNMWDGRANENVECISLVEIMSQICCKDNVVLKMDCEGAEYDILYHTPIDVLRQFKCIYIEIHDESNPNYLNQTQALLDYMKGVGFDVAYTAPQLFILDAEHRIQSASSMRVFKLKLPEPKVYDTFLFYNELDLLELRLNELNDVVDKFVLVESDVTFTGKPKPFYYEQNKGRFAKFQDKIIHVKLENIPPTDSPWKMEEYQRNAIFQALQECSINDIILLSDVDEIPNVEAIRNFDKTKGISKLQQRMTYYYFNCIADNMWWGAKIGTWKDMRSLPANDVRAITEAPVIENGGWHFSYVGNMDYIVDKIGAFSHQEYNTEYIKNRDRIADKIAKGEDLFGRNLTYSFADLDESFPRHILENKKYYTDKGYIKNTRQVKYSIVIPTYNHCNDLLKPCIESIIKQTTMDNVEIIVVANGCTDNTKEYVESIRDADVRLLWFDEPLGYTIATNNGIKAALGEYIILLNNDTVILDFQPKNTWIEMLEAPFKESSTIGMTSPIRLYNIQFDYHFLSFACAMVPRRIVDEIGLLDEKFNPGFAEDDDYALRLAEKGYQIKQVPFDSFEYTTLFPIYHVMNATIKDALPEYDKIRHRNMQWLIEKHLLFLNASGTTSPNNIQADNRDISFPESPKSPIKLHLNCGDEHLPEYLNCDPTNMNADMICDIVNLPFPNESIDEILVHISSSEFFTSKYHDAVDKMHALLKPKGKIIFSAPYNATQPELYLNFITYKTQN